MANQRDPSLSNFLKIVGGLFGVVGGFTLYGAQRDAWKAENVREAPYVKLSDVIIKVISSFLLKICRFPRMLVQIFLCM
jgi:hypothetical protein